MRKILRDRGVQESFKHGRGFMGNSAGKSVDQNGFRVLGVQPSSPAAQVGLVSFFDFIVAANDVPLQTAAVEYFVTLIREFEDRPLPLRVYNCKNHSLREVTLVPSKNWPGEGRLGVAIRYDCYSGAEEALCRILTVEPNSPAELAGLIPSSDYLLGTQEQAFVDTDSLGKELEKYVDKTVELYVYNSDLDEVRVVVVMPSRSWGKKSGLDSPILGADVACGFLHRLPEGCCHTTGSSTEISLRPSLGAGLAEENA